MIQKKKKNQCSDDDGDVIVRLGEDVHTPPQTVYEMLQEALLDKHSSLIDAMDNATDDEVKDGIDEQLEILHLAMRCFEIEPVHFEDLGDGRFKLTDVEE